MSEFYPVHIMTKPEGLPYQGYIDTQLELLEVMTGSKKIFEVRTILTPDEVDLIYPDPNIPTELKTNLATEETQHRIILGNSEIYPKVKELKGKMDSGGIRQFLLNISKKHQFPLERWQNFLHTSDNLLESQPVCSHFLSSAHLCQECAAKSICFSNQKTK